jgi:chromate reductase, NAD(P)H dehydrogenase (quinone)
MSSSYTVGYIIGSLSTESINRTLSKALIRLAPENLKLVEIPIRELPVYKPRLRRRLPASWPGAEGRHRFRRRRTVRHPGVQPRIPGSLKNAIDWASRPYGTNSFARKPSAVIGASPGKIGTALAQQHLRSALSFCNAPQMGAPEAYIQFTPGLITDDGEVTDEATEQFLRDFMDAFGVFVTRVLTVLPREG